MSMDTLLEQIGELAKAQSAVGSVMKALPADGADDKKIAAAAAEGGTDEGDAAGSPADAEIAAGTSGGADAPPEGEGAPIGGPGEGDEGDEEEGDGGEAEGGVMAKSFTLTLEDGTEVEAFDGAELLKSLSDQVASVSADTSSLQEQVMKSMQAAVSLIATQGHQIGELAKSLGSMEAQNKALAAQVAKLSAAGRGPRSTLTVADKPGASDTLAKAMPAPLGRGEILAKSMTAHKAGRISGLDASKIETALNMGVPVPADLMAAISN